MMMNENSENKENLNELTDEQQETVSGGAKQPSFNRDDDFPANPAGISHPVSHKQRIPLIGK